MLAAGADGAEAHSSWIVYAAPLEEARRHVSSSRGIIAQPGLKLRSEAKMGFSATGVDRHYTCSSLIYIHYTPHTTHQRHW